MRNFESRVFKCLAVLAVVGPVVGAPIGAMIGGGNGAMLGIVFALLPVFPLGFLFGCVLSVANLLAQRRELLRKLASSRVRRTMTRPSLLAPLSALIQFGATAAFAYVVAVIVGKVWSDQWHWLLGSWLLIGLLTATGLLFLWGGMRRAGDFIIARRAWKVVKAERRTSV